MLSSFTRDEKKVLVFLAALLGAGSCLNLFWGARGQKNFTPIAKPGVAARAGMTTGTLRAKAADTSASLAMASLSPSGKIDLNSATAETLETLPGVGPKTAEAILAFRQEHGGFASVDELENVKGLGPAKVQRIVPYVEVGSPVKRTMVEPQRLPGMQTAQSQSAVVQTQPTQVPITQPMPAVHAQPQSLSPTSPSAPASPTVVNINTDGEEKLQELQFVGPVLAKRIVEDRRQRGLYPTVESLDRVKGIGPHILKANRYRMKVR